MAKEELVGPVAEKVKVFDKHVVAELMSVWGHWKAGPSTTNNTYKTLLNLVELGKLEKCDGFFRVKGCKSEYKEHSQILTRTLVNILKVYPDSIIFREHTIHEVGLRPDALVLLMKGGSGLCIWLEVCNLESPDYFDKKKKALQSWNALPYISKLFGYNIPAYHLVKDTEVEPFLEARKKTHG